MPDILMLNWITEKNQSNPQIQPSTSCGLIQESGDKSIPSQSIENRYVFPSIEINTPASQRILHNYTTLGYFPLRELTGTDSKLRLRQPESSPFWGLCEADCMRSGKQSSLEIS